MSTYDYTFTHANFGSFGVDVDVQMKIDFIPLVLNSNYYNEELFYFVVQMCAIVGGILTVAGIVDSVLNKSVVHVM